MPQTECTQIRFNFHPELPIKVIADAPQTSSDGGWLLLRQADEKLGLSQSLAACLSDDRLASRIDHSRREQVAQRLYQIAMGYEDCNDGDTLRDDPLLKTACGRLPDSDDGLSSQPTLSRFENCVNGKTLNRLCNVFEDEYVDRLPRNTHFVVLDIDTTDDETHGHQQLTFFHGYYGHYMYHPLFVFDGETGELISALLRSGKAHSSKGASIVLRRVIRKIKARFPHAQILVRGDSGFCVPRLLDSLERLDRELGDIDYVFGIAKNSRLLALGKEAIDAAEKLYWATGRSSRYFQPFGYAAESWSHERCVIMKAEHLEKGANPRYVVTSLDMFDPKMMYERVYCGRGQCENYIKDFKNALKADRLSCCQYNANFFRLLLHTAAYRLMHAIRCAAVGISQELARCQLDTLRLRLLKVAALVRQSARRIWVRLPRVFPLAHIFSALAVSLGAEAPA